MAGKPNRSSSRQLPDGCFVQSSTGEIVPMQEVEVGDVSALAIAPVTPFVSSTKEQPPATVNQEVTLPPSRFKISMVKAGFPRLVEEIEAGDATEAKKKFFAKHGIVRCERDPDITLVESPAS